MVLSSVIISFSALVIRSIETATATDINFYRAIAFIVAVFGFMLVQHGKYAPRKIFSSGLPSFIAGIFLAGAGICFLKAITSTTVAATLFTLSSIPIITAFMAWILLGEKVTKIALVSMAVACYGISLMVIAELETLSILGNLLAIATAIFFAAYATTLRKYKKVEMIPALLFSGAIIFFATLPFISPVNSIPLRDIFLCFVLGAILSAICNMLFIVASKHLLAAELTLFMLLEFALGPFWVWIFASEVPSNYTLIGGAIVMFAVLINVFSELKTASHLKETSDN